MKKRGWIILCVVVLLGLAAGYQYIESDLVKVKVIKPVRGDMETAIRVTGRVINDRTVTMTALVNGQIEGMHVQKGDHVKAGQILADFDKREADAELAKARAVLAREEQSVEEAEARLRRMRNVKSSGGSTQQEIDDAEAELNAARSRLRVARSDQRLAMIHREKIEVLAPFDGVITEKTTEKGQWVEAGTKLFTLVADEGREIEVWVDAADSGTVRLGQTVRLTSDAYPDREWEEKIHWIAPSINLDETNEAVNTFAVRISISKHAPPLLLGQQVDAYIVVASKKDVLHLPYSALRGTPGNYQVAVVRQGTVTIKPVRTGIENDTHVEIVSGLGESDQVVLSSPQPVSDGQLVEVSQ